MKKNIMKIFLLMLAMVMVIAVSACGNTEEGPTDAATAEPTSVPGVPTMAPGDDLELVIDGPSSDLKAGDTVTYTISLKSVKPSEGLIGIDYTIAYDSDMLVYTSEKQEKTPGEKWESCSREGEDKGVRIYSCFDDSDEMDKAAKGNGDYELTVTFDVQQDTAGKDFLIKLYDVSGAINNDNLDMAYGTGNTIALK